MTAARDTSFEQQALRERNTTFTPEALASADRLSFERILTGINAQAGVQSNVQVPEPLNMSSDGTPKLYVSTSGFSTLGSSGGRMLFVPEGDGADSRPADVLADRKVDQVVLHSFGWRIDKMALRSGARTIQVESEATGYNPYKVYARLQQVLSGSGQATSHIISRRGDIISSTPWNRTPAVNTSQAAGRLRVGERSISIELEAWHTSNYVSFRSTPEDTFRIVSMVPYTSEQMTALAFLLKKLAVWSSNVSILTPMGFTLGTVQSLLGNAAGHEAGTCNYSALSSEGSAKYSPGGEFQLPLGWALGDDIPAHMAPQADAWRLRFQKQYVEQGVELGTPLSSYDRLIDIAAALPVYSLQTEIFGPVSTPIFEVAPATSAPSAPSETATRNEGEGFSRSQEMQATSRSGLYSAGPIASDAVYIAAAERNSRDTLARITAVAAPVITNALGFDYNTGQWVYATTTLKQGGPEATP